MTKRRPSLVAAALLDARKMAKRALRNAPSGQRNHARRTFKSLTTECLRRGA